MNLAYSSRNRSASVRIPMYAPSPKAKRLEFRCPDPSCNPYLAFAAMLMAGLDGIQNKIDPGEPLDKDIYALSPEELEGRAEGAGLARRGARRPGAATTSSCSRATSSRRTSSTTWIEYKRENEVDAVRLRPHPLRVRALLRQLAAQNRQTGSEPPADRRGRSAWRRSLLRCGPLRGPSAPFRL